MVSYRRIRFIGKNILNYLILNDQIVIGFDKNTIDKSDYDRIFYNNPNRKKILNL